MNIGLKKFILHIADEQAKQAVHDFCKKKISEDRLAIITIPYLKRVLRAVWHKFPKLDAEYEPDDFLSKTWSYYRNWMIKNYDESYPLTPVTLKIVNGILLDAIRKQNTSIHVFNMDEHENAIDFIEHMQEEFVYDNVINTDAIDAKLASEKILVILAKTNQKKYDMLKSNLKAHENAMRNRIYNQDNVFIPGYDQKRLDADRTIDVKQKQKVKSTNQGKQKYLSDDQKKLVEIFHRTRLTQQEFCDLLEIGMPRFASYIYGTTKKVNAQVMEKAYAIDNGTIKENSMLNRRAQEMTDMSMTEILMQWAGIAQIEFTNNKEMAILCGTTISAISRWKNNKSRPSIKGLLKIEQSVIKYREMLDNQHQLYQKNNNKNEMVA